MKKTNVYYQIGALLLLNILTNPALASRLEEAAHRGQSIITSIGQTTAVIGIVLGGTALSIGMANIGRMVLMSGIVGAAVTFAGPAIIDLLKDIFR